MIVVGDLSAFIDLAVEAFKLRFDLFAHPHHHLSIRRHLINLVPCALQLLTTQS